MLLAASAPAIASASNFFRISFSVSTSAAEPIAQRDRPQRPSLFNRQHWPAR